MGWSLIMTRQNLLLLVAVAAIAAAVGASAFPQPFGGFADCPCISFGDIGDSCVKVDGTDGACMPKGYGELECKSWDEGVLPPCSVVHGANRRWCGGHWCFVDPNNCTRPTHRYGGISGAERYISHATCGFADPSETRTVSNGLQKRPLRVSYPSDDMWRLVSTSWGEKKGAVPSLFQYVVAKYNATYEEVPLTVDGKMISARQFPESADNLYQACVHAVAVNQTDLCLGAVWVYPERSALAHFTGSFDTDVMYLVSLSSPSMSAWEMLARPFLPFSPETWGAIMLALLLSYLVNAWLEWPNALEDLSTGLSGGWKDAANAAIIVLYHSFRTMWCGAGGMHPVSYGGKLLNTGLCIFCAVVLSSYTANLAAFLTSTSSVVDVENIDMAIEYGYTICAPHILKDIIIAHIPGMTQLLVPKADQVDVLVGFNNKDCDAAIIDEAFFKQSQKDLDSCDKVLTGSPLMWFNLAMPVSAEFQQPLSTAILEAVMDGVYETARLATIQHLGANKCFKTVKKGFALGLDEMAGVLVLMSLFLGAAILVGLLTRTAQKVEVIERSIKGASMSLWKRLDSREQKLFQNEIAPDLAMEEPPAAMVTASVQLQSVVAK